MGLSWGLGHGTTLVLLGLPLVLLGRYLPAGIQQAAEVAIGIIIVVLALRLLVRWRRGFFHAHHHTHEGGEAHRHLHSHAEGPVHEHAHSAALRTPLSAYGVGLVHGVGGSGGLTLLLLSTIPSLAIAAGPVARNFERVAPVLGTLAAAFGVWYVLGALGVVGYPF